jgi:hypothetical protein
MKVPGRITTLAALGTLFAAVPVHAGPPGGPTALGNPVAGYTLSNSLSWTNVCSTTGAGGQFFPTCVSATLNQYSNGWLELFFWNRAGYDGTFADAAVRAIGIGGLDTPGGTRGTGWDAGFGGWQIGWLPDADIPGPNTGNGFITNGNGAALCSDFATACPGGIVTTDGGNGAQFYWYSGTGALDPNLISLQLHSGSGPNGWSTGYFCFSDGYQQAITSGNVEWSCADDPLDPNNFPFDEFPTEEIVEVVPEPATMTLLGSGIVGLIAARRRKRLDS